VTSLFDCCRERLTKGLSDDVSVRGQSFTFYATQDGGLADAGSIEDGLSPTTKAWL
jgi:hypothetical protein